MEGVGHTGRAAEHARLIEFVILNVGYDLGVISKEMFALMVMMALVTTFMTGPLLTWIYPKLREQRTVQY
jgi:Kef-type K+ transport system membrane component KefB